MARCIMVDFIICGKLLEETGPHTDSPVAHLEEDGTVHITQDFGVWFQSTCHLLEPDFPTPAIQLELDANIPWMLPGEHGYEKDITRRT